MSLPILRWKIGFEIELLAPVGRSRLDLANAISNTVPGSKVVPAFLPQAEISLVEGAPVFENLTLAYEVLGADGARIVCCGDDLTLQNGLKKETPPKPGWYRIVGDDPRFLRLIMRHADPGAPVDKVLEPIAELFGTELEHFDNGMVRLGDPYGAPIAMAAPLPGERERPCEIITPPLSSDHGAKLSALLEPAIELSFTVPNEAALHIHYDATDLCEPRIFANLIRVFDQYGEALKELVETNPNCRRLGGWPDELKALVFDPQFAELSWEEARDEMTEIPITKFVDFNICNMVFLPPDKHTFEVRILPVSLDVEKTLLAAALFEALLNYAIKLKSSQSDAAPLNLCELIEKLPLEETAKQHWQNVCQQKGLVLLK